MKCPYCGAWSAPKLGLDPGSEVFVCENGDNFATDYWTYKKPGLYLELLHGRSDPDAALENWGFGGPVIGPLVWFHTTYLHTLRILFVDAEDAEKFGLPNNHGDCHHLAIHDDMIEFSGNYYGDWSVYNSEVVHARRR